MEVSAFTVAGGGDSHPSALKTTQVCCKFPCLSGNVLSPVLLSQCNCLSFATASPCPVVFQSSRCWRIVSFYDYHLPTISCFDNRLTTLVKARCAPGTGGRGLPGGRRARSGRPAAGWRRRSARWCAPGRARSGSCPPPASAAGRSTPARNKSIFLIFSPRLWVGQVVQLPVHTLRAAFPCSHQPPDLYRACIKIWPQQSYQIPHCPVIVPHCPVIVQRPSHSVAFTSQPCYLA